MNWAMFDPYWTVTRTYCYGYQNIQYRILTNVNNLEMSVLCSKSLASMPSHEGSFQFNINLSILGLIVRGNMAYLYVML